MRAVADFRAVVLEGFGDAEITQVGPDGIESLEIEADEAMFERLKADVAGGKLYLGLDLEWWEWLTYWATWMGISDKRVRYRIAVRVFEGAEIKGSGSITAGPVMGETCRLGISGSGKITLERLDTIELHTQISGSGEIRAAGQAAKQEIQINGSGDVEALELETKETTVRINGGGRALVNAEDRLDVRINGSGDVQYAGDPRVSQSIAGSGSVRAA
jgi:hypothetical protein